MPPKKSEAVAGSPLFKELCKSVAKETHNFTFACGGSIPIVPKLPENEFKLAPAVQKTDTVDDELEQGSTSQTRYGPRDPAADDFNEPPTRSTFSIPVDPDGTRTITPSKTVSLLHLEGGAADVYDESYRKATKLDPSRFSSTFNPYEVGIVDTIAQTLLPTLRHLQQTRTVKAELYKLNFYSAPSGKFKAHVDTPRSPDQFGSLVVCLPVPHKGGALEVRHKGKTVAFDWAAPDSNIKNASINWAAFYSDCEHEVLEVIEGHRLTLTYNLYIVRSNGFLGGYSPALDPTTLPPRGLYKTTSDLVHDPKLWKDGGHIGYHCSHIYPHTATTKLHCMVPDNLKGADMAMYSILRSLILKVSFRPAVPEEGMGHYPYDSDTEELGHGYHGHVGTEPVSLGANGKLKWEEWYGGQAGTGDDFDIWTGKRAKKAKNGDSTHYSYRKDLERVPSYLRYKDVHWLNEFGHKVTQVTYPAVKSDSCIPV
ncbi:hypothetical protein VMCG_07319 [Cytospora schulzeri]|uniref:Fe2OG dioxygenase domain-containing protein n=1 Tax=Cytospora schulzeri TaxID=448051 RepID=A0A423WAP7_9PEZI|nr:hypothetical protein VMCG_07319 [Valsa malicola]